MGIRSKFILHRRQFQKSDSRVGLKLDQKINITILAEILPQGRAK